LCTRLLHMPAGSVEGSGEVLSTGETSGLNGRMRRAPTACVPCKQAKKKCDHGRPCRPCIARGLEHHCQDAENKTVPACSRCRWQKLKCDRSKPCRRCIAQGCAADCMADIEVVDQASAAVEGHTQVFRPKKRAKKSSASPEPSSDGASAQSEDDLLEVARPISFPEDARFDLIPFMKGSNSGPTEMEMCYPSTMPLSFRRMFSLYRTTDQLVNRMYETMTPRLRYTINRIFGTIDTLTMNSPKQQITDGVNPSAIPPSFSSARCGFQGLVFDKAWRAISQIDSNSFWTDLAGLHKEEYVSRTFADDFKSPTSEFRQLCKFLQASESALRGRGVDSAQEQVFYSRFTKNWGSTVGLGGEGVMTRMRFTFSYEGDMTQVKQAIVVISPEEYEAAVRLHPQLCEHLASQVMGRKPVQELLSPQLIEDESVLNMSRTAEGRAKFDHLADILDGMFSFLPIS